MCKISTFFFCLFTVLNRLKDLQLSKVGIWSDFWQDIIDNAVDQWRKHLKACVRANVGHFEHLLWKNLQTICNFSCLFGLSGFCPSCQIFTALSIMSCQKSDHRPTLLNCKSLSLLKTVNKQKEKCWYFAHC